MLYESELFVRFSTLLLTAIVVAFAWPRENPVHQLDIAMCILGFVLALWRMYTEIINEIPGFEKYGTVTVGVLAIMLLTSIPLMRTGVALEGMRAAWGVALALLICTYLAQYALRIGDTDVRGPFRLLRR